MERKGMRVVFGAVPLDGVAGLLGAHHWALKVGEVWREVVVVPDSNDNKVRSDPLRKNLIGEYEIKKNPGDRSESGAVPTPPSDFWLTNLLLPAIVTAVIFVAVALSMGVPLYRAAGFSLILPLVTLIPRLENLCRQESQKLIELTTFAAGWAGLVLVVALLAACKMLWMLGLLAVWFLWRVWWSKYLSAWRGEEANRNSILGTTWKTEGEISQFDRDFMLNNPEYLGLSSNCQRYVRDLFEFLVEDEEKTRDLPPPESIFSLFNSEDQKKKIDKKAEKLSQETKNAEMRRQEDLRQHKKALEEAEKHRKDFENAEIRRQKDLENAEKRRQEETRRIEEEALSRQKEDQMKQAELRRALDQAEKKRQEEAEKRSQETKNAEIRRQEEIRRLEAAIQLSSYPSSLRVHSTSWFVAPGPGRWWGVYKRVSGLTHNGRPVWKSPGTILPTKYFFYNRNGYWMINDDYKENSGCVLSVQRGLTHIPETGWKVAVDDHTWKTDPGVTVVAV